MAKDKSPRSRSRFPKDEGPPVTEKVRVSTRMQQEIERLSSEDSSSKSAFMGRIIRNWLKQNHPDWLKRAVRSKS